MAERRMFAKTIIESDAFLDLPAKAQMLYVHLSMRADDEGFVNGPKQIMRMTGATEKDLKTLIDKKFIIMFDSGVVCIKHWRINNYIRDDRRKETVYQEEMRQLSVKENGAYTKSDGNSLTDGSHVTDNCQSTDGQEAGNCQLSIGEGSIGKGSIGESERATAPDTPPSEEDRKAYGPWKNVMLTDAELQVLQSQYPNWQALIDNFSEKIKAKGYTYANHCAAICAWEKKDRADRQKEKGGMMTHGYDYDALFGSTG